MKIRRIAGIALGLAVCACNNGSVKNDFDPVNGDAVQTDSEQVNNVEQRDTLISDTITTDEGYRIIEHRFSVFSNIDSVDVLVNGERIRSELLNSGGYVAAHTSLEWSNERFICFYFGCGSPCWGDLYLDLRENLPMKEIMYPIWSDSVRSVVLYPDTALPFTGLILEDLANGSKRSILVDSIQAPISVLAFDSVWVKGGILHLRRGDLGGKLEEIDL